MTMKHSLQLRLSQHLTLTPQLQQSIRLLQLSTLELNQEIEKFLRDNPLLERDEGVREEPYGIAPSTSPPPDYNSVTASDASSEPPGAAASETRATDTLDSASLGDELRYSSSSARDDGDESDYPQLAAESQSLRDHLYSQLSLTKLGEDERRLVAMLIDSLGDDGYMHQDLNELVGLLPPELGIGIDELTIALRHLQSFDPPGIAARNLGECLRLQLEIGRAHV